MTSRAAAHPVASPADHRLRAAFTAGETLDLRILDGGPDGSKSGTRQVVHARLIRDLLLADPVPNCIHQLSIRDADIRGKLDLRFAKTECALRLEDCTFDAPVTLSEASLRSVSFRHSVLPEIDARHVTVTGDLVLDTVEVTDGVRLDGAHIADDLHLANATIGSAHRTSAGQQRPLLDLQNVNVKGTIDADHLTVHGQLSTISATVGGAVRMTDARLHNAAAQAAGEPQGTTAWKGDGMTTEGVLNASGLQAEGSVSLIDARVRGLVMHSVQVENARFALVLDRLSSRSSVFIDGNSSLAGGIHAIGMQVGASLYLRCCQVSAPVTGSPDDKLRALDLRRAKVSDDLRCDEGFQASGLCDLTGCHVTGRVALTGARMSPAAGGGAAFTADGAQISGDLYGDGGFTAQGTMSMVNARVGGSMTVEQAGSPTGGRLALAGAGLSVARDMRLDIPGSVDLSGAEVNGDLTLRLKRLGCRKDRAAADLSDVRAGVLTLYGRPRSGFLDLTRARVTRLLDNPAAWPAGSKIVLDGLEYSALAAIDRPEVTLRDRLAWLETGTQWSRLAAGRYHEPGFAPQPYRQLAALYERAGDDRKARATLLAMYRRHNKAMVRFGEQPLTKTWNLVQDLFLGYGYVPWHAVAWLSALALGTTAWFAYFGHSRLGFVESALLSLSLVLPGSGYDKLQPWARGGSTVSLLIAAFLVMCGLLLGASVIAALGRAFKTMK